MRRSDTATRPRGRSGLTSGLLIVAGCSLLLWVGARALERQSAQRNARAALTATTLETEATSLARIAVAPAEAVADPRPAPGSVIGRIVVPAAGVDVVAFEGVDARTLDRGAGHVPGTALPGEPGNSAFAAHRDVEFRGLRGIARGHDVFVDTGAATFVYRVESTRIVEPSEVAVLSARGATDLTLITCYPFDWVGPAPQRFVVRALLRGRFEAEDRILDNLVEAR